MLETPLSVIPSSAKSICLHQFPCRTPLTFLTLRIFGENLTFARGQVELRYYYEPKGSFSTYAKLPEKAIFLTP